MGSCRPYRRIGTSFDVTLALVIGGPLSGGNTTGRRRGNGTAPASRAGTDRRAPGGGGAGAGRKGRSPRPRVGPASYWSFAVAPASSSPFFAFSASSFERPVFTGLGAPSTRSFASLRPRFVSARTTLITLILFAPADSRITSKEVFSSFAAAGAPPPPPAGAAIAAATAWTPNLDS